MYSNDLPDAAAPGNVGKNVEVLFSGWSEGFRQQLLCESTCVLFYAIVKVMVARKTVACVVYSPAQSSLVSTSKCSQTYVHTCIMLYMCHTCVRVLLLYKDISPSHISDKHTVFAKEFFTQWQQQQNSINDPHTHNTHRQRANKLIN